MDSENTKWLVCSNLSTTGWDYHAPIHVPTKVANFMSNARKASDLADVEIFEKEEEANDYSNNKTK